jgi:hypothetical protein
VKCSGSAYDIRNMSMALVLCCGYKRKKREGKIQMTLLNSALQKKLVSNPTAYKGTVCEDTEN